MTTISDSGVSLPNFDDEWRSQDKAAQAVALDLLQLTMELDDPSAIIIHTAVEKLVEQHKNSRSLSEKINSHYKRSKREIDEQKAAVKTCNEELEKCVEEKKQILKKAKEYRVKIKILERKYVENGGSLDGLDSAVNRDIKQEDRKRAAEEVNPTKTNGGPMVFPAQKRMRTGSSSSDGNRNTPSTAPTELSPRNTPRHISASQKRQAEQKRHFTPIAKAKRANFAKRIPLGQEHKFASNRLATPNRLVGPTKVSSHVTAVFQGLAASVKAHEPWADLTSAQQQAPDLSLLDTKLSLVALRDEVSKKKNVSRTKAFVDFIAAIQMKHPKPLNAYSLYRRLFTSPIKDPAKYLEHVLASASGETLTHAFKAPHRYFHECSDCNGMKAYEDHEFDPRDSQTVMQPTHETEPRWLTNLRPHYTDREYRSAKPSPRDLNTMLHGKFHDPEHAPCTNCKARNSANLKKTWEGYSYAPENLSFSFERGGDKKYKLTLPLEHDFAPFIHGAKTEAKYSLVTVVKKLEKSSIYAAFVHGEDGKWWRCIDDEVKMCGIEDWQADGRNGETVLAMYERLE